MVKTQAFRRLLVWTLFGAILVSAYLYQSQNKVEPTTLFFPHLSEKLAVLSKINITLASQSFVLEKKNDIWVISNKADLPVKLPWLRELIEGMVGMQIMEAKTQNPNAYAAIAVDMPTYAEAKGVQVEFFDNESKPFISAVIGKRQSLPSHPEDELIFVRMTDVAQSYIVSSRLPPMFTLGAIASENILPFQKEHIQSLSFHNKEEKFSLDREKMDAYFNLSPVPKGKKLKSKFLLNDIAKTLQTLKIIDIEMQEKSPDNWKNALQIDIKTFEGHAYHLSFLDEHDKIWLSASPQSDWIFIIDKDDFEHIAHKESDLFEHI